MCFRVHSLVALAGLMGSALPGSCLGAEAKATNSKSGVEFFEKKIRPVLVQHCYECHSEKSKIVQANLYLDTREGALRGGDSGPAVVPGKVEESQIVAALRHESVEMPPKGKLPDEVIADFAKWIDMGAPDPRDGKAPALKVVNLEEGRKHWAYQPPRLVPPSAVKNKSWPRTDIDRYILAALESTGLAPVADADADMLIRRVTFDLTGLPPTPQEIEDFTRSYSPSPVPPHPGTFSTGAREHGSTGENAYEALVDRLLASPRFGERWGRHWLDVARYAESSGKERNVPYRMAWRYRDYVIDAFNADMPFDQFVREQLAGDLLPHASVEEHDRQRIATGFLAIGPRALTERVPEQYALDVADEQLDTVCRALLASTAGCARCHDHKFDPIPTTDYYALIGIFRSTENVAGVRALRREFSYMHALALGDASQAAGPSRDLQERISKLETEGDRIRSDQRDANKKKDTERQAELKRLEAESTERLLAARAEAESAAKHAPRFAMAVRDGDKVADYAVRIRGELADLGPVVPRGFLSVITSERTPKIAPTHSGRLELAEWIASRDNPLTARVFVNRLWQHLFGKGLIESADNFGLVGEKPSHPELLDYLAVRFMNEGWSVKRALREMVLSRTYQLSSQRNDAAYTLDPGNRLLWRFARRRLEAEAIRDAMLAVSGQLDLSRPHGSATLTLNNLELGSSARSLSLDDSLRCRGVYLPLLRGNVPEMLGLFDLADPSLVIGQREVTTVATQALYLMNSKFVMDQARRFAERLLGQKGLDDRGRVELAYRLTLTRAPSGEERRQVLEFVRAAQAGQGEAARSEREAWTDVCQVLFGSAEFLYVR